MVSLYDIHRVVAENFELEMPELFELSRRQEIVEPRKIFYYLARELNSNMSWASIASYGIPRNRATVMHAHKSIKNLMDVEKPLKSKIGRLLAECIAGKRVEKTGKYYTFHRRKFKMISELSEAASMEDIEKVFRKNFN